MAELSWECEDDHGIRWYAQSIHRGRYGQLMQWCIEPDIDGSFDIGLSPLPPTPLPEHPKIYTLREAMNYAQDFENAFIQKILPELKYNMYIAYCYDDNSFSFYSTFHESLAKARSLQGRWIIYIRMFSSNPLEDAAGIAATRPHAMWDSDADREQGAREKYKVFWPNGFPTP